MISVSVKTCHQCREQIQNSKPRQRICSECRHTNKLKSNRLSNKRYYRENREELRKYASKYWKKNRIKINEKRRQKYIQNPEHYKKINRAYKVKHREEILQRERKKRKILRIEVLTHYAGKLPSCVCCGEKCIEFLTLDHVNGGGLEHKRKIGNHFGSSFYKWLKDNNFPKFNSQILCLNCNITK